MITSALFIGSKKFGLEIFKALYHADRSVAWTILCPPDENDTRTHLQEFQVFCNQEKLELTIAKSPQEVLRFATERRPDVAIVCGYYRLLPDELFLNVRNGVWGIHNSLLPKYRGGSPLVWQIINGEETIGSSFFKFASGIDNGPVLEQVAVSGCQALTIKEAMDLIELEWISRLPGIWKGFCNGSIEAREQDHSKATYCALRNEFDGEIDFHQDARTIDRFVRAQAAPYPRAYFTLGNRKIRIVTHEVDSRVIYGTAGQVYEVRERYVTVCCGQNSGLRLTELETDGKTVAAVDILNSIKLRI